MDRPSPELVNCPHCDVFNPAIDDQCGSCGKPLTIFIGPRPKVRTFRLADGMAWIAASAVSLALMRANLAFGLFFSSLVLPALLRTMLNIAERRADGRPMRSDEVIGAFFASIVVMFAILGSAIISMALMFALFEFLFPPWWLLRGFLAFPFAFLVGIGAAIYTTRKLWPRWD